MCKIGLYCVNEIVQIRVSSNVLILKVEQSGRVWKRVIKQKHPGAISLQSKNGGEPRYVYKIFCQNMQCLKNPRLRVSSLQHGGPQEIISTLKSLSWFRETQSRSEEAPTYYGPLKTLKSLVISPQSCQKLSTKRKSMIQRNSLSFLKDSSINLVGLIWKDP